MLPYRSKFSTLNWKLHRPNEDFNLQRFFMKMKIEDEKPLFFSSSKIWRFEEPFLKYLHKDWRFEDWFWKNLRRYKSSKIIFETIFEDSHTVISQQWLHFEIQTTEWVILCFFRTKYCNKKIMKKTLDLDFFF